MADEIHTNERLAVRIEHIQRCVLDPDERALFVPLINQARAGYYHDYMSPIAMPDVQLVTDLRELADRMGPVATHGSSARGMIGNLVSEVIDGKFEATVKEGEDWLLSEDGQRALAQLREMEPDGHQAE
jgi:hypothetical protein